MRPVLLKVRGLRSYRGEHEFDFEGRGLVAVIGDTGAGKSSILEGICFALYGTCTWSGSQSSVLVADGLQSMTVELTFRADGQTWRVARTVSAETYPPARHLLECLDDGRRFDNSGPVNREIERLLGMDYRAFLRAVILPQGRFQELLQSTATERTRLLKGIFRVDEIEEARANAASYVAGLKLDVAALEVERAAFLPDPTSSAAEARASLQDANALADRLSVIVERVSAAKKSAEDATRRRSLVQSAAADLQARTVANTESELRDLASLAAQLRVEQTNLIGQQQVAVAQLQAQRNSLDATLGGIPLTVVLGAAPTLQRAARDLDRIVADHAALEARRNATAEREQEIALDESTLALLRAREQQATEAVETIRFDDEAGVQRYTVARDLLGAARSASSTAQAALAAAAEAEQVVARFASAHAAATTSSARSRDAVTAAENSLEQIRKTDAAARAAHGKHAGDDCPVCRRALPDDWQAPIAEGEPGAIAHLDDVRKRADAAQKAVSVVGEQLAAANSTLDRANRDRSEAGEIATRAAAELLAVLPGADVALADEVVLAAMMDEVRSTRAELLAARAQRETLLQEAAAMAAQLGSARTVLQKERQSLVAETAEIEKRRSQLERDISALPPALQPGSMSAVTLEGAARSAATLADAVKDLQAQIETATSEERRLAGSIQAATLRMRDEVDGPLATIRMKLVALETQAEAAGRVLSLSASAFVRGESAAETATWAANLSTAVEELLRSANAAIAATNAQDAAASEELARAFSDAGVDREPDLTRAVTGAAATAHTAERDMLLAESHIAPARELDTRIANSTRIRNAVDDLVGLLADSKFISFITQRRQVALLGVASELLGSMTGGRYGFAADFRVVDRHSGQVRAVQTLSGGETFLASLALALALVELAGRSKGRLEALFLDEGFASLDSNALAQAIDALRIQATDGRLVAVISHLHAVAESFDDVMLVTREPSGSVARWLEPAERDALLEDEARSRLLA